MIGARIAHIVVQLSLLSDEFLDLSFTANRLIIFVSIHHLGLVPVKDSWMLMLLASHSLNVDEVLHHLLHLHLHHLMYRLLTLPNFTDHDLFFAFSYVEEPMFLHAFFDLLAHLVSIEEKAEILRFLLLRIRLRLLRW